MWGQDMSQTIIKNWGINIPLALKDNYTRRERVPTRRIDHFEKQAKADFEYYAKRERKYYGTSKSNI